MTRSRAHADGVPSEMMVTYYRQRAGAALIITEATIVCEEGVGPTNMPGLYTSEHIEGWRSVTSAVHERGGRIFVQLFHAGRISHPSVQPNGALPVAPSALKPTGTIYTPDGVKPFTTPRALATEEISMVVRQFERAAEFAESAGFDGAEIHAANGYLIDQFLRDGTNHRADAYGGSPENRARFLHDVVGAVSNVLGADRTGVRLSPLTAHNDMSDSAPEATFGAAIASLENFGLAYIHIVEQDDSPASGPGFDLARLRESLKTAYIANGEYDRERAEAAIGNGVNFVSFGKLFLANPDLPHRFASGAPLNQPDPDTFYDGDERGYTDYPTL